MYLDISEYDSATYYYLWTIRLSEAIGRYDQLPTVYNNLGTCFRKIEDYEEALKYLEMALEYNKDNDDDETGAQILSNIGATYLESGDVDMAPVYFDQAREIFQSLPGDLLDLYDLYNNYAEVYELKGKYNLAINSLEKAIGGYSRQDYDEGLAIALKNMGDIYIQTGRYDLARKYLDSSMRVSVRAGYKDIQLDILGTLAENYNKTGDYKRAYKSESERFNLYREIFDLDKDRMIKNLKLKYEREKDQAEILALTNANLEMELDLRKKTAQRNGYLYAGIGIIILGLFVFLYLRQRVVIARQRILQLEEEKKLMAAKLLVEGQEQERKRIARELHDGLGVLLSATKMQFTSIKDISPENQPLIEKATQLLEQASGDVRKISHNMMPGLLTKMGFFEAVEDLFENINDTQDIQAKCEFTGEQKRLPENMEIMLYRIVQEMVNNTIKHADAKNIELKMKIFPGQLIIKYSDDGMGFKVEEIMQKESGSLGLKNMQSRIGFLKGEMDIQSSPGEGVNYTIQVPV
jgi:signal transduction histidine kinase